MSVFAPRTVRELGEVVAWAAAEEQPIEVVGGGSKRRIGRKLQVHHVLDLGLRQKQNNTPIMDRIRQVTSSFTEGAIGENR